MPTRPCLSLPASSLPASSLPSTDQQFRWPRPLEALCAASFCAASLLMGCNKSPAESQKLSVASASPAPSAAARTSAAAQPSVAAAPALLSQGAALPQVSAPDQTGTRRNLREFAGKPLVVYFYPKDDSPGCTVEAQEIRDIYQDIRQTGASVVGVSTDDAESHRAFAQKHSLPFTLLADPDREVARAFGVPLNEKGRSQRMTFVFSAAGRLEKVFESVTPAGHGRELLAEIKALH